MNQSYYDSDYFERGLESGKSAYQNYRWEPELTIPLAMTIVDYLDIKRGQTVLDYGCAKGYLVKALRLLYREAYGFDVSKYALSQIDADTAPFCSDPDVLNKQFDFVIAKDVFEHMDIDEVVEVLRKLHFKKLFAVIPLGDGKTYDAPINNLDKSHIICQSIHWWYIFFENMGFKTYSTYEIKGIKDSYYKQYPNAHGFFTLGR